MPKTVLLADDSVTIQRVVELTFANEDVTIVSVGDGDRAIEAIRQSPPDLVLADIEMPGRTGYDVVQFIRQEPQLASLPVLLLAGAFEPVDDTKARLVGADGILTKPFDPAILIGRVHELLTGGRGAVSVVQTRPPSTRAADILGLTPVDLSGPAPAAAAFQQHSDAAPADAAPAAETGPDAPPAGEQASPVAAADSYFDQIDQAFAALSKAPRPPLPAEDEELLQEDPGQVPQEPASEPRHLRVASSGSVPLTDAFAALLEAERSGNADIPAHLLPAPAAVPPAIDMDVLSDQIARKVLEQLSDRVVRETVADIVSSTAERLVREEIERIKRNIK